MSHTKTHPFYCQGNWSPLKDNVLHDFLRAEYKRETDLQAGDFQIREDMRPPKEIKGCDVNQIRDAMALSKYMWDVHISPSLREVNCGPCAKQQVFCILVLPAISFVVVGRNSCFRPQTVCPREQGEDYSKCKTVCAQPSHAEVDACHTLLGFVNEVLGFPKNPISRVSADHVGPIKIFLFGHTYACDGCKKTLRETLGTDEVTILESLQELRGHLDSLA